MLTFGEFKQTRANQVVGICTDRDSFRELTNESCERLMTRGNFWNTVGKLSTCVQCRSIVWPRMVDTVLATNLCNRYTTNTGYWSEWLPMNGSDYRCAWSRCSDVVVRNDGVVPVQAQLRCGAPRYVRAYPAYQADVGKTVTLFGIDDNGQEIFSKRSDGTYRLGYVLTLAIPFVGTPFLIRKITRVLKDATEGPLRLYAYDASNDVLEDL